MKITKEKLNIEYALEREWIITNGIGGFSSSTIIGANTRKYHGLLIAPLTPPARRFLVFSKLDEALELDGEKYELFTNVGKQYISQGFRYQESFEKDFVPIFKYKVKDVEITKIICMEYGKNTVGVYYKIKFKNCMNANWSKIQDRIKYTIKELKDTLDAKVSLFKFEVFNGSNNKFYNIVLMVKGIEYDKLPESYRITMEKSFQKKYENAEIINYIAIKNETPIGTATILYNENKAIIYNITTLKDYKRKGVCKRTMSYIINELKKLNIKKVCLQTEKGYYPEEIYKKMGFKEKLLGKAYKI